MRNDEPKPPIACSLDDAGKAARDAEFEALVSRALVGRERAPGRVRLRFRADPGVEAEVRELARLEKECCPFFEFGIARRAGEVTLDVSAPEEAERLLDVF